VGILHQAGTLIEFWLLSMPGSPMIEPVVAKMQQRAPI
jgi:hypothetical protein